jgi:hypothetical protein
MSQRISLILNILFVLVMTAGMFWHLLSNRKPKPDSSVMTVVLYSQDGEKGDNPGRGTKGDLFRHTTDNVSGERSDKTTSPQSTCRFLS